VVPHILYCQHHRHERRRLRRRKRDRGVASRRHLRGLLDNLLRDHLHLRMWQDHLLHLRMWRDHCLLDSRLLVEGHGL